MKKSEVLSKKSRNRIEAQKMVDAGLITASMVKKNRWFVKNPYETSYTKISSVKRYQPPPTNPLETQKVSRKAYLITKKRARDTGKVKPDTLYSKKTSVNALKLLGTAQLRLAKSDQELFIQRDLVVMLS